MKRAITIVLLFLFLLSPNFTQNTPKNRELVDLMAKYRDQFKTMIENFHNEGIDTLPIGERVLRVARSFEGTPYKPKTLEGMGDEFCRFNLDGLDCFTLVENSLCIARVLKNNIQEIEDFVDCLRATRYRDGIIKQYPSRLHYTADWIYQNSNERVFADITKDLGGKVIRFNVGFMTDPQNIKYYPELSVNDGFLDRMKQCEKNINQRTYYYIPKENVAKIESKLRSGDIIAITSTVKGLDYAHIGIAFRDNFGKLHLFHASSVYKKVVIDKQLSEYLEGSSTQTGITVLRPVE